MESYDFLDVKNNRKVVDILDSLKYHSGKLGPGAALEVYTGKGELESEGFGIFCHLPLTTYFSSLPFLQEVIPMVGIG